MSNTARRPRVVEGSCYPCRKRRIKCDLGRPSCSRCLETNQTCGYGGAPFRWVGGMALRGRHAPNQSPELRSPTEGFGPRRLSESSNTTSGEGSKRRTSDSDLAPLVRYSASQDPYGSPGLASPLSTPPPDETTLVPYFANAVLPRFLLGDGSIPVDQVALTRNASLQQTILAIARAHYDMLSKSATSSTALVRTRSRHDAIASFRQRLERDVRSGDACHELFTVNVLLCMLDGMIEPSDEVNASSVHLKGGFAMLNRWKNVAAEMLSRDGMDSHLLSVFVTMDLVHAVLSGRKPYFESLIFNLFADIQAWWGRLPSSDRLLTLFKAFSDTAAMAHLIFSGLPSAQAQLLTERILPQVQNELHLPYGGYHASSDSASEWATFCSLYEIATWIFLQRAVKQRKVDDEAVQSYAVQGLTLLSDGSLPGMLQHCLVLPMAVIGAHCIRQQDQRAMIHVLNPTVSYLSFGNLPLLMDFLKEIWTHADPAVTWWKMFESIAEKVFLF